MPHPNFSLRVHLMTNKSGKYGTDGAMHAALNLVFVKHEKQITV